MLTNIIRSDQMLLIKIINWSIAIGLAIFYNFPYYLYLAIILKIFAIMGTELLKQRGIRGI